MKNIFCVLSIFMLCLCANENICANEANAVANENKAVETKEVLIDSNAMRHKNSENAKKENVKNNPFEGIKQDNANNELAKALENDTVLSQDKEVLDALSSSAGNSNSGNRSGNPVAKSNATQKNTDNNVYGTPYSISDTQYFPSRRRSSR